VESANILASRWYCVPDSRGIAYSWNLSKEAATRSRAINAAGTRRAELLKLAFSALFIPFIWFGLAPYAIAERQMAVPSPIVCLKYSPARIAA
jgi:hypothetical protein